MRSTEKQAREYLAAKKQKEGQEMQVIIEEKEVDSEQASTRYKEGKREEEDNKKEEEVNGESEDICRQCMKTVKSGVYCGKCTRWWHYRCQGTTRDKVKSEYPDEEYQCNECKEERKDNNREEDQENREGDNRTPRKKGDMIERGDDNTSQKEEKDEEEEIEENNNREREEKEGMPDEERLVLNERIQEKQDEVTQQKNEIKRMKEWYAQESREKESWNEKNTRKIAEALGKKIVEGRQFTPETVEEGMEELITKYKASKKKEKDSENLKDDVKKYREMLQKTLVEKAQFEKELEERK